MIDIKLLVVGFVWGISIGCWFMNFYDQFEHGPWAIVPTVFALIINAIAYSE